MTKEKALQKLTKVQADWAREANRSKKIALLDRVISAEQAVYAAGGTTAEVMIAKLKARV